MKSILLLLMATSCVVSPLSVTAQTPVLLRTFNNPAPEAGDFFGAGMAALGWPAPSTGFVLQQNTDGIGSLNWSNVTAGVQDNGTTKSIIVNPTGASRFFRLVGN